MPYVWTVKQYKGDFLYRTTDVAIWTTVEVGVGITAGNLATLRPLFQKFLAYTGLQSSSNGATSQKMSRRNGPSNIGHIRSQVLDDLRGDGNKTVTTVVARGGADSDSWADKSRESEDDILHVQHQEDLVEMKGMGGISKNVEITTVEERSSNDRTPPPDEETGGLAKPALIYERF